MKRTKKEGEWRESQKKRKYHVVVHGAFIEWVLSVHLHSIPFRSLRCVESFIYYTHTRSAPQQPHITTRYTRSEFHFTVIISRHRDEDNQTERERERSSKREREREKEEIL